jgi:hypothetical protein
MNVFPGQYGRKQVKIHLNCVNFVMNFIYFDLSGSRKMDSENKKTFFYFFS